MIDLELVKEPITEIFEIDDNEKEILDSLKWWEVELIEMNQQYSLREMQQQLNINYAFIYRTIKKIKDGKKKK
jgi:transposase-like protein